MAISPELLAKAQAQLAARRAQLVDAMAAQNARKEAEASALGSSLAASNSVAEGNAPLNGTSGTPLAVTMLPVATGAAPTTGAAGGRFIPNAKQQLAADYLLQGKSFCLIGAAGTGKTSALRNCLETGLRSNYFPVLDAGTKHLRSGAPGAVCIAYTRRAVRQIARNIPKNIPAITAHKLVEFAPVYYETVNEETGAESITMRFEPMRNASNPLPHTLKTIVIDEASMMSTELFDKVLDAILNDIQVIVLGDLHQLPPVYGNSILADKLVEWPVIELTEVYRQALESPIIQLATKIKDGIGWPVVSGEKQVISSPDGKSTVTIQPMNKRLRGYDDGRTSKLPTAMDVFKAFTDNLIKNGGYDAEEDVILMPFNKACGVTELNKHIANTLSRQRGEVVHHVISGYVNHYFAVGDRIMVEKEDCVIMKIAPNPTYYGKLPMKPSRWLDREGHIVISKAEQALIDSGEADAAGNGGPISNDDSYAAISDTSIENILSQMALVDAATDEKFNNASHVLYTLTVEQYNQRNDPDYDEAIEGKIVERQVTKCGDVNSIIFSYALTVHKSQGSEWRRVFFLLHYSHNVMLTRELAYTAITRAREELFIVCEPDAPNAPGSLTKAAISPRIIGDTLEEKIAWLRNKSANDRAEAL